MRVRRCHISWLIAWACFGYTLGIGLAFKYVNYTFSPYILIIATLCITLTLIVRWRLLIVPILIGGFLLGAQRATPYLKAQKIYAEYYGKTLELNGKIAQDPDVGENGIVKVQVSNVNLDGTHMNGGNIWVSTVTKVDIKRGDHVSFRGKLSPGFGVLPASMYQASLAEASRPHPGDMARHVRDWFAGGVRRTMAGPEASLGLGYLVGQKTALPASLEENIRLVGLTHAVVASGYNLTILVVFCRGFFMRISKYTATLTSMGMIICFMFVTGFSPSMSRAGLVAGMGLLTWYYGRSMHPFVLLSIAAAITTTVNPSYVWGDMGWYLSFTAFIGVIVLAPLLHRYFWGNAEPSTIRSLCIETVSAQIVTQPLIQHAFGTYSVYALPANLAVLPLVPLAMLTTFIAGLGGLIAPSSASVVGAPAYIILHYSVSAINWWASLPNAQHELTFHAELMWASYSIIGATILFLIRRTGYDFRSKQ